jgi:hypothetical protein
VVVVPLSDARDVIKQLETVRQKEEMMLARILSGNPLIPEWVDEALTNKGCEIIDLQGT